MEGIPDVPYFTIMHFCDECVEMRDLPAPDKVIPEELWDYENRHKWNTVFICGACFKEYSQQKIPTDRFAV